jgi:hypothetical protein
MRMFLCFLVLNVNDSSSFLPLVLDVYIVEDVPSNLNQVQSQSFETIIDCLKAISVALHSLNELRSNTPPSSLMDSTTSPKVKTTEGEGVGVHSLVCNTSRLEGRA